MRSMSVRKSGNFAWNSCKELMRNLAYSLIGIGLLFIAFFALADFLGLGGDSGIGATQLLGIQIGALAVFLGIGLLTTKWDEKSNFRKKFQLSSVLNSSTLYWVLGAFLITYILFFLLPVFFSRQQIHYLTKYIPDAYITRIGFDIEAIVSRIEAWLRTGQSPYADGFIAYPPLAIAIFATFSIIGYPAYFKLIVVITVLAYLLVALIIPLLILPNRSRILLMLFFVTGLFSYGLQFEQERGQFNLITFMLCLNAIYIFHFHHKFRYYAYLLFSLSIQLKVYPVFFVVMFVSDWRDWRNNIKRILGLGIANFLLLFVLGYRLFLDFVKTITNYQLLESSRYENLSIKGFAYYLSNEVFESAQQNFFASANNSETFFWLLLGLCFLLAVGYVYFRNERGLNPYLLLISTIAALIIPSVSNDYKLSLLITPMMLTLGGLPELPKNGNKIFLLLLVGLASLAYWTTLYPATVKSDFMGRNFPALIVILISATVLQFLAPYTYEGRAQEPAAILSSNHE